MLLHICIPDQSYVVTKSVHVGVNLDLCSEIRVTVLIGTGQGISSRKSTCTDFEDRMFIMLTVLKKVIFFLKFELHTCFCNLFKYCINS